MPPMKVRLHKNGETLVTDDASGAWLVEKGYAEKLADTKKQEAPKQEAANEEAPSAPRRGRPPKAR